MKIQLSQTFIHWQNYMVIQKTQLFMGNATFFVTADKNLDDVMKELNGISGINWKSYTLVKSSSNYPALEQSISGMYKMANLLFWGSWLLSPSPCPLAQSLDQCPSQGSWNSPLLSVSSRQVSWDNSSLNLS